MDADGLPLIGTGIDFTKVEAIHQKRTLAFLNHFITHTARFMNKFSSVCEEKLSDLSVRIQRLETNMAILEAKLSSIPGLDNITVSNTTTNQNQPQQTAAQNDQQQTTSLQEKTTSEQEAPRTDSPQPTETPTMTVAEDPRYATYFRMLNMGVPAMAVKQKMEMAGLNPDLLSNPSAPSDLPPPTADSDESSDALSDDSSVEFSD